MVELTRDSRGGGQQYVMLISVQARLGLADDELESAVAYGVEHEVLERGPGSIALHKKHLRMF